MLKKLILRNFQAHEKLVVEFDPHVTVVVGSSDVGKSAIIRALRWLTRNAPDGNSFIRHGTSAAKVSIFVDKHVVRRERGKKANRYLLNDKELVSFGRGKVPDHVAKVLQIEDLNFQLQHQSPFWFGESAGSVSKQLNQIVNLGSIDAKLAHCASLVRAGRAEISVIEKRIAEGEEKRKSLGGVKEYHASVYELVTLDQDLNATMEKTDRLSEELERLSSLKNKAVEAQDEAEAGEVACEAGRELKTHAERVSRLSLDIDKLGRLEALAKGGDIDFSSVSESAEELRAVRRKKERLFDLLDLCREAVDVGNKSKAELASMESRLEKLRPETCPTCGQKLPHKHE